jgi:uncharacterized protein
VTVIKRFIAGAVCPKCGLMDRLVMYRQDDKQIRECVSCDFSDEMRFNYAGRELETRVNRTQDEREAEVKVVKFLDPGAPSE